MSIAHFSTPTAVALDDEGVLWVSLRRGSKGLSCACRLCDDGEPGGITVINEVNFGPWLPCDDLAISGDALLVLCVEFWRWGQIYVLDKQTGAIRYEFGSSVAPGGDDELRDPRCMALGGIGGEYCFVADTS